MTTSVCGRCGKVIFRAGPGRPRKLCPDCRSERYGRDHKARRKAEMQNYVGKPCSRCGQPMEEGDEVHLDHRDGGGPNDYLGLSHAKCNLAGAARKRAAAAQRDERRNGRLDPGPPRTDVVHDETPGRCHCEERAHSLGAWPSRCW